ncbi:putative tachykinin-like peptides receptor 86C [Apostichopus japonicus]|uniref:Putative tachykinin-like peptides receptor 86C n=1 Tax=Stichopus japonicus TaxID=307972 RepID=A0A2G8KT39_STIJA|nr:putative tachykinin-like peptides receptor 86C [Apostichopus japonicus]
MATVLTTDYDVTTEASTAEVYAAEDLWVVVLMVILGVVGVIGNTLVCIIIFRARFLHNLTNYLILSLAVADLSASFFLVVNVFPLEAQLIRQPPSSRVAAEIYCRFYSSRHFFWVSVTASVFNLVCVTFERFFAIVYPLHYPLYFNLRKVQIMIFMTWAIPNLQEAFAFFINPYLPESHSCGYGFSSEELGIFVGVFVFLISYFLPLVIMIFAYYLIFHNLKKETNSGDQSQTQVQADSMSKARKKVVQVLIIVVIAFTVLWTPNQVSYFFENLKKPIVPTSHTLYKLFRLMAFSNSVINPFIYAFKYKQFRKGFRVAICNFPKNQVGFSNDSSDRHA